MVELDHILWAAPDLDQGSHLFEALTGVAPARGGSHPGFGTRNSLVALEKKAYLEIISPDPEQRLDDNRGGEIAALPHPGLLTFALRATDLHAVGQTARAAGLDVDEPIAMSRMRPDGVVLKWSVLHLRHPTFAGAIPFAIDWGDSPHPSETTPRGCRLRAFSVIEPDPEPLARIYSALGVPVEIKRGARAGFLAVLDAPKGEIVLTNP
jgi:hypothetical protein